MKVALFVNENEIDEIREILTVIADIHNENLEIVPITAWVSDDGQVSDEAANNEMEATVCIVSYPYKKLDIWHLKKVFRHFYLYVWGILVDPDRSDWICRKRDEFAQKGDLRRAKIYNKLLAEITFITKKSETLNYPVQIQVESTTKCNARCIMCEHFYNHNSARGDLAEEGIGIISEVLPYAEEVFIHGIGEPFLAKNILPLLHSCNIYQNKVSTNSNMSYLTDEILEELKTCFYRLMISCDGATEDVYSGIRRGTRLADMFSNVKKVRNANPDINLRMSVVAMRQNVRELPSIVRLAHDLGVEGITISNVVPNPLIGNEMDCLLHYPAHMHKYMRMAKEEADSFGMTIRLPELSAEYIVTEENLIIEEQEMSKYRLFPKEEDAKRISEEYRMLAGQTGIHGSDFEELEYAGQDDTCRGICDNLLEKPFIDSEGNVAPCCINPMYHLGNIYETGSLMAVWNGEPYQKLRREFYEGRLPRCCRNCQFLLNHTLTKIDWYKKDTEFFQKSYLSDEYKEILCRLEEGQEGNCNE